MFSPETAKAFPRPVGCAHLAVVLVFLVLLVEFQSFTPPLVLSSAVLSTSGVFFALLATRMTFNVSSFMQLIMVIGIVAKNGILLMFETPLVWFSRSAAAGRCLAAAFIASSSSAP